ncbi:MAG: hypothetical protein WA919_08830 [Coleofasciculaceae cyanobacterium]
MNLSSYTMAAILAMVPVSQASITAANPSIIISQATPEFTVTIPDSHHDRGNSIIVEPQGYQALIHINSRFGIGNGTIKLVQGEWPKKITLRFYLSGLEGLEVSNGTQSFNDGDLRIRAMDWAGNPLNQEYLLNDEGYYEVGLPDSLILEGNQELSISWVDFYR